MIELLGLAQLESRLVGSGEKGFPVLRGRQNPQVLLLQPLDGPDQQDRNHHLLNPGVNMTVQLPNIRTASSGVLRLHARAYADRYGLSITRKK